MNQSPERMTDGASSQKSDQVETQKRRRFYLDRPSFFIALILFLATLTLYVSTLAPSVVTLFDDSLEFQLVTYQLGIAHPTGYPLYTILGKLFTFLPVGNVAYRINLMSAVFGAATIATLYLLILRMSRYIWPFPHKPLFTKSLQLGAILGAVFLAISPIFWKQATIAEVYTLNAFFVATILWLAVGSRERHLNEQQLLWLAFLAGLSLTHHRTMLLLLPALVIYLYLTYKSRLFNRKLLVLAILWGALPLLLYLYLPLRGHIGSLDDTYQNSWAGFWRQVSGGGYGTFIFDNPFGQERDLTFYWNLLTTQFFISALGVAGLVQLLLSRQWKLLILTIGIFVTYLSFNVSYQVSDIEVFFIPIFLIWAVWIGLGVTALLRLTTLLKSNNLSLLISGLFLLFLAYGTFLQFQKNWQVMREKYGWQIHDYGVDILRQPLPEVKSVIIGIVGEMTLIRYFQQTEGLRPDVTTIAADLETERLAVVEKSLNEGKAVYLTRDLPGAAKHWSLNAVGPLIHINRKPITSVSDIAIIKKEQPVTEDIKLLGYHIARLPHTGAGLAPLRLTLFWQAVNAPDDDLKVSARLLDAAGDVVAMVDTVPVHFAYPTTAWRQGEIVADVYDLALPPGSTPGAYIPLIIWYDPAHDAAEVGRVELEAITIE